MEKDYSLVIAATVAIVAIVGLIMYFGVSSSGAVYFDPWSSSTDGAIGYALGEKVANAWNPNVVDQNEYCSIQCGNVCRQMYETGKVADLGGDCTQNCETNCNRNLFLEIGIGPGITK